jgi:ABC-2 type transport system ATP-binding protein
MSSVAAENNCDRMLEARELTVNYGTFTAVDRVSIHARAGEVLGLLGPNGAGKTSVIRALTTIVPVAGGTATINGHALTDAVGVRSSIGVLPESNGYPPAQTASSYLRFYGQLFGLPRATAEQRAERLLRQFGLGDSRNRIATFSRGMRQRLGLARALINDPAVLFLDEPTLGLDPAGKEEILQHLTRAAVEEGICVVLCTHLLDEVERVCDRVAIMHKARIVVEGTVHEVVAAADIPGYGTIRVAPADWIAAEIALRASPAAGSLHFDNTRPGDLDIRLATTDGGRMDILRLLLDAGIEPRSFDLQGARLSEAFLALTGAPQEAGR